MRIRRNNRENFGTKCLDFGTKGTGLVQRICPKINDLAINCTNVPIFTRYVLLGMKMQKKAVFSVWRMGLTFSNRYIGTKCKFHTASDDDDGIDGMTVATQF